ncbi:glycosyltransferase family 4 protein [Enterovibrio sp. ZSDZ42]|uniref:Glycosyltransferase family 4 protein n=1 Tax=Enterovibrio gelatinilyticus TaxID=2899819 RepID=A0ABT5QWI9_9GAMM|nr:glycosyltransferase family 4 protein [Enterovibrio sp. ZSDZ42]MDD1792378.1 glycosyltransferase family 4 protein [Enterovibrio sp. ZSDZ42]
MKILVVSQYFWPENFRINDLVCALHEQGHEVTVLTGKPNYPDGVFFSEYVEAPHNFSNFQGIEVLRVPMLPRKTGSINLLLNYVSFAVSATFNGVRKFKDKQFDVILACQLSPVTSVLPAIAIKKNKKIPLAMWSLDLWPESLQAVGIVKSEKAINLIGKLVSYIYGNCDLILAQSEAYLSAIRQRDKSDTPTLIFPNWAEDLFSIERSPSDSGVVNILFAGNIGDAQDFDAIVECAKLVKQEQLNVVFSIVGDGRRRLQLEEEIARFALEDIIVLLGQHPLEAMPNFYSKADAALVTLKSDDIFSRTVPGKVQSYMLASLPVLGMIDGAASQLIKDAHCGLTCDSGKFNLLFENIVKFLSLSDAERAQLGKNGYEYASTQFNKQHLVSRLEKSLEALIEV